MKKLWKNYSSSLLLLGSVIIGGVIGAVIGPKAEVLKPIGSIFINLMFVTITPLVFFSVASSVAKSKQAERVGKIFGSTLFVFITTAAIAAVVGYIAFRIWNPFAGIDADVFMRLIDTSQEVEALAPSQMLVNMLTVSDFMALLSKNNLLPMIIFSLLFGFATLRAGDKGAPMVAFLESGAEVVIQFVQVIMKFAPIGLGCYFAYTIGAIGPQILGGYLQSFIWYLVVALIYFSVFTTLYVFIAGGMDAVKIYWKNLSAPALSAIATTSSAACIPVNILAAKEMYIPDDIAETVLPLGANTHKDGSVIGGILKIVFLFTLFNRDTVGFMPMLSIIGVGILVGVVIGSIPSGGLTAELTICTLFGFPPELVAIILVISTIIDIPATLLNSTGNIACAMLVTRLVDGKDWLVKQTKHFVQK